MSDDRKRLTLADFAADVVCDWVTLWQKDRRKGGTWLCKACGMTGGGLRKTQPACPVRAQEAASDDR